MIDDEEYSEQEFSISDYPLDSVAARCESVARLIVVASKLPEGRLLDEAVLMLSAVRRSFVALPAGKLTSISGGKSN